MDKDKERHILPLSRRTFIKGLAGIALTLSRGADATVQVWEAATGSKFFTYSGHTNEVYTVAWSSLGTYIASGSEDTTVQIWKGEN